MPLPQKLPTGMIREWSLDTVHSQMQSMLTDPGFISCHRPGSAWFMGYILPPFQRGLKWDQDRKVRFIESAVLGVHLGFWSYNSAADEPMERTPDGDFFHHTDRWLIDGQQRFNALKEFWENRFPVFDTYWRDFDRMERFRFLRTSFPAEELALTDEAQLREIYDRKNFGGVAHTAEERATLQGQEPALPTMAPRL